MIKMLTGVRFTPQEFRLLNQCVRCGKASAIKYGATCELCKADSIGHCDMCNILMRHGKYTFYTYDIKEEHRTEEEGFKTSKELVREFSYELSYENEPNTENLCSACFGWQTQIKNRCCGCGRCFLNTIEHYKEHGNYCADCIARLTLVQNGEEKTRDNIPAREGICHSSHPYQGV